MNEDILKSHFHTIVAKEAIVKAHGAAATNWPTYTFWVMVSTVKYAIQEHHMPALLKKYNLTSLSEYEIEKGNLL